MTAMLRQIDPPPAPAEVTRACGSCGYDLRGIVEARCPECGTEFDRAAPIVADVPWLHRTVIGVWAALWRTLWSVTLQPHRLICEAALDTYVDARAARTFRRICVAVAAVSIALLFALCMPVTSTMVVTFVVGIGPLLVFFNIVTLCVNVKALESPPRAPRIATLHAFTAAPLLLLPLAPITCAVCALMGRAPAMALLVALVILALWLVVSFTYQQCASGRSLAGLLIQFGLTAIVWSCVAWFCFLIVVFMVALTNRLFDW